ncbi:MAG: phosphoribosyltransferase family protein [Candidatus Uhrbacteria bacterium]
MLAHERPGVELIVQQKEGGPTPILRISWSAFFALIDECILMIVDSGWTPDQVVAVTFGGILPGRAISEVLGIPLAYFGAESYEARRPGDREKTLRGARVHFDRHLLKTRPGFGSNVIVAEDLTDTGFTLTEGIPWLQRSPKYGTAIQSIKTVCLWRKEASVAHPDFTVDEVVPVQPNGITQPMIPWIRQPLEELYSVPTIADIRARVRATMKDDEQVLR